MTSGNPLDGRRVVILAENMYEDLELWYPFYRMKEAGAQVSIIGSGSNSSYKSKHGYEVKVDSSVDTANSDDLDVLIIPGGFAPDYMRRYPRMVRFVADAYAGGKVVAAICHAGSMLVSAGILKGRTVTCFKSIRDDVVNAGAKYVDKDVVRDGRLITSRFPDDLPAFCREIISVLSTEQARVAPTAREKSTERT